MKLKDLLDKKRDALLEEEQKQAQRLAVEAVEPHPLRGRKSALLDDYVRGQLVLRKEGDTLDKNGDLLRPFAVALGIPLKHFADLLEEVSNYDEESHSVALEKVCGELKKWEEIICFLCDMVRLHGDEYALEGEFLDLWRSVSMGLFQVASEKTALLERLCERIAKRERRRRGDDCGDIPRELVQYYLSLPSVGKQYLVIDLSGGADARQYPVRSTDEPPKLGKSDSRTTELWLRRIPAGSFKMGSPAGLFFGEKGRSRDETQHRVTLTKDYYIGVFPCTQRQYELVMGSKPSKFKGVDNPVEKVSYNTLRGANEGKKWPSGSDVDKASFFGRLQARTGLVFDLPTKTWMAFDLPTEAEWEYACRAGTTTALNSGRNLTTLSGSCPDMDEVGWYDENSDSTTHPVGQKKPNAWGLYDMHGNVQEWCLDWYQYDYPRLAVTDPHGPKSDDDRVARGGSWDDGARYCRSAVRSFHTSSSTREDLGFRIALRS